MGKEQTQTDPLVTGAPVVGDDLEYAHSHSPIESAWASFELHYQPLADTHTCQIVGYESLMRLRDADGTLIYPDSFLPCLERSGLMPRLGRWAITHALRDHSGCESQSFIAINLGQGELAELDLEALLHSEYTDNGLSLDRVMFEITEEALSRVEPVVIDKLAHLRSLGVRIALDDFGTGYSCLARLLQLPCDVIKLDRLFIQQASNSRMARRLCQVIVEFGHEMGLTLVAEGVESEAQAELATRLGCDLMQGFWLGHPRPLDG